MTNTGNKKGNDPYKPQSQKLTPSFCICFPHFTVQDNEVYLQRLRNSLKFTQHVNGTGGIRTPVPILPNQLNDVLCCGATWRVLPASPSRPATDESPPPVLAGGTTFPPKLFQPLEEFRLASSAGFLLKYHQSFSFSLSQSLPCAPLALLTSVFLPCPPGGRFRIWSCIFSIRLSWGCQSCGERLTQWSPAAGVMWELVRRVEPTPALLNLDLYLNKTQGILCTVQVEQLGPRP